VAINQALVERTIYAELNRAAERIRQRQKELGKVASGKSARTLEATQIADDTYALEGEGYFRYQQLGSGPHKNPEPPGFVDAIREWLKVKRLDIPLWAVVTKIRNEGTSLYRGEKKPWAQPLGLPEIFNETEQRLERELSLYFTTQFSNLFQDERI
jgi:hypothetical protein